MKNIRNQRGITLVALVITIIILIILAGVSINAIIGENGIITLAKRAKENIELAQIEEERELNELYMQLENQEELTEGTVSYNAVLRLNEFKKKIADYIDEAANGTVDLTNEYTKPNYQISSAETFGNAIKQIVKNVTSDATATASDIAQGKTAYINGNKITGTLSNNILETKTISSNGTYSSQDDGYDGYKEVVVDTIPNFVKKNTTYSMTTNVSGHTSKNVVYASSLGVKKIYGITKIEGYFRNLNIRSC